MPARTPRRHGATSRRSGPRSSLTRRSSGPVRWRPCRPTRVLAGSDDERDVMAAAIAALEGRVLQAVAVRAPAFDATWSFADDHRLRLFLISVEQGEHWLVYLPDGNVLSIGPETRWSVESATARSGAPPA